MRTIWRSFDVYGIFAPLSYKTLQLVANAKTVFLPVLAVLTKMEAVIVFKQNRQEIFQ